MIIKANKTDISESQEGLILDAIKNGELIVFSFGLSKETNLPELDEAFISS